MQAKLIYVTEKLSCNNLSPISKEESNRLRQIIESEINCVKDQETTQENRWQEIEMLKSQYRKRIKIGDEGVIGEVPIFILDNAHQIEYLATFLQNFEKKILRNKPIGLNLKLLGKVPTQEKNSNRNNKWLEGTLFSIDQVLKRIPPQFIDQILILKINLCPENFFYYRQNLETPFQGLEKLQNLMFFQGANIFDAFSLKINPVDHLIEKINCLKNLKAIGFSNTSIENVHLSKLTDKGRFSHIFIEELNCLVFPEIIEIFKSFENLKSLYAKLLIIKDTEVIYKIEKKLNKILLNIKGQPVDFAINKSTLENFGNKEWASEMSDMNLELIGKFVEKSLEIEDNLALKLRLLDNYCNAYNISKSLKFKLKNEDKEKELEEKLQKYELFKNLHNEILEKGFKEIELIPVFITIYDKKSDFVIKLIKGDPLTVYLKLLKKQGFQINYKNFQDLKVDTIFLKTVLEGNKNNGNKEPEELVIRFLDCDSVYSYKDNCNVFAMTLNLAERYLNTKITDLRLESKMCGTTLASAIFLLSRNLETLEIFFQNDLEYSTSHSYREKYLLNNLDELENLKVLRLHQVNPIDHGKAFMREVDLSIIPWKNLNLKSLILEGDLQKFSGYIDCRNIKQIDLEVKGAGFTKGRVPKLINSELTEINLKVWEDLLLMSAEKGANSSKLSCFKNIKSMTPFINKLIINHIVQYQEPKTYEKNILNLIENLSDVKIDTICFKRVGLKEFKNQNQIVPLIENIKRICSVKEVVLYY